MCRVQGSGFRVQGRVEGRQPEAPGYRRSCPARGEAGKSGPGRIWVLDYYTLFFFSSLGFGVLCFNVFSSGFWSTILS